MRVFYFSLTQQQSFIKEIQLACLTLIETNALVDVHVLTGY
ncbi:MAG: hypothetical protein PUP93_30030 [Rhizonema sp. NSF051]|nr:hypothetical protein [Rhizonema sp. NSF051]